MVCGGGQFSGEADPWVPQAPNSSVPSKREPTDVLFIPLTGSRPLTEWRRVRTYCLAAILVCTDAVTILSAASEPLPRGLGRALTLSYATGYKEYPDWRVHCGVITYQVPDEP
jgi:hypothetical protein